MRKINQSQFDDLMTRRVNAVGKIVSEIVRTVENNPDLLDEERLDKITKYIGGLFSNTEKSLTAIVNAPKIEPVGEFVLGTKQVRKPRASKKVEGEPVARALEARDGDPVVSKKVDPAPAPVAAAPTVAHDDLDDIDLGDLDL